MKAISFLAAFLCFLGVAAWAEVLKPVTLEPMEHLDATLSVTARDGSEVTYSAADLEQFTTYRLETTTPWRDAPAVFEGARLSDILAAAGLEDAEAIVVMAENEYKVSIPRAAWEELNILVATRVNGGPISRRERGPIQFVVDADAYNASSIAREDFLVWMAARIASDE